MILGSYLSRIWSLGSNLGRIWSLVSNLVVVGTSDLAFLFFFLNFGFKSGRDLELGIWALRFGIKDLGLGRKRLRLEIQISNKAEEKSKEESAGSSDLHNRIEVCIL